jgi:hypothetical protein
MQHWENVRHRQSTVDERGLCARNRNQRAPLSLARTENRAGPPVDATWITQYQEPQESCSVRSRILPAQEIGEG